MINKTDLSALKRMRELLGDSDEAFNTLIECVNIINTLFYEEKVKIAQETDPQKRAKMALKLVKNLYNYWTFASCPEEVEKLTYS
jgi:hypothetical protein